MPSELPPFNHLLVLPRLRVQNANAISSPLTWGFPSITAFTGVMQALERRLGAALSLNFNAVGVICHGIEAQTTEGFTRRFHLTRNPVGADGGTAAIVEEGRMHLDLTLILGLDSDALAAADEATRQQVAMQVADELAGMRIGGGSVMPPLPRAGQRRNRTHPTLRSWPLHYDAEEHAKAWRRLRQSWLPGFALVARDDLLAARQRANPDIAALDAWLDAAALIHHARRSSDAVTGKEAIHWEPEHRPGWIVPIPVGYAALSPLHPAGSVTGARDRETPFRFVESIYSLGQWISPHRIASAADLLWWSDHDEGLGLYRCRNTYPGATPVHPFD